MALHDVDKGHQRRSAPTPNTNDQVVSRPAHGTVQNHNAGEAALEDGLKLKERQILAVQNGFNKAAFGFYGTANKFGLKVAQEGVDVLTASDDQLIFNSEQNVFKIVESGTLSVTLSGVSQTTVGVDLGGGSTSYGHSLGYRPVVVAYVNFAGVFSVPLPTTFMDTGAFHTLFTNFNIRSYTTEIRVDVSEVLTVVDASSGGFTGGGGVYEIKFYLLQETAI